MTSATSVPLPAGLTHKVRHALGRWLAVRMVVIMCVAVACVLTLSFQGLSTLFDEFEQSAAQQQNLRVQSVLKQDAQTMAAMAQDYAQWDDAYHYVQGQQPEFMAENFNASSMRNLRLDAVLVVGEQGKPRPTGAVQLLPEGLFAKIQPDWYQALLTGKSTSGCAPAREGGVWAGKTLLMVATVPITNTAVDAPPRGCLLFVRELDAAYLAELEQFSGIQIALAPGATPAAQTLTKRADGLWEVVAPMSYLPGSMHIQYQSQLSAQRSTIMAWMMAVLVLVTVLAVGTLYGLVHFKVVRRLRHAANLANDYRHSPDADVVWPNLERDEIDNLGLSLNELVAQVKVHQQYAATHDVLTGLNNRRGLEAVLATVPFQANDLRSQMVCLVLLDLDNFKVINDGFGHAVGDALLVHVSLQLQDSVRQGDSTARIGGDQFALLLQGVHREQALALVTRLMANLRRPLVHGEAEVSTSASVGMAFSDSAPDAQSLLRHADLAMHQAKQRGRNCWSIFNEALYLEAQRRSRLVHALRRALDEGRLQVAYQPVLDVRSNRITSMEALARWTQDGEAISPAEFIPLAENNDLIGQLGMQVLDQSCALLARLRALGYPLSCSVNLSIRQFIDHNLRADVPARVAAHGLPPAALRLEITESLVADAEADVVDTMRALHAQGFDFLLDDFGTGQSSLHRLQNLPFQTLKIDRSFVQLLQLGDQVMVRTVVNLARALGLAVVAEGVETPEQLNCLIDLGVTHAQGFLLARPMPEEALIQWLGAQKQT